MYYSTAGDSINGERYNHYKWTYYMLGAGGEQLAVYKGVQAAHEDSSGHMGRRVYMYNESYISLGGTLVTLPDNTKQFNAMDNIGSVRLTVSVNGDSLRFQSFDYKPFGDTLNAEDESRIGYASQERDEESRYFAMGARQYDPLSGRFLSVDPLYESFPDKTPYHYCNNNPISFRDPSGLSPEGEKGKEDEVQVVDTYSSMQESEFTFQIMLDFMEEQENWQRNFRDQIFAWSHMNDAQSERMRDFGGGGSGGGFDNSSNDDNGDRTGEDGEDGENKVEEVEELGCIVDDGEEVAKNGLNSDGKTTSSDATKVFIKVSPDILGCPYYEIKEFVTWEMENPECDEARYDGTYEKLTYFLVKEGSLTSGNCFSGYIPITFEGGSNAVIEITNENYGSLSWVLFNVNYEGYNSNGDVSYTGSLFTGQNYCYSFYRNAAYPSTWNLNLEIVSDAGNLGYRIFTTFNTNPMKIK